METAKWGLKMEERDQYIDALGSELASLRAKAGLSQEELCSLVGISRQTYSPIELQKKSMSWTTYLAFVWFFDNNVKTREMLRKGPGYPKQIIETINGGKSPDADQFGQTPEEFQELVKALDGQAVHTIKTMLLIEYARCKNISGDTVVKAFNGLELPGESPDAVTEQALKNIRNRKK